MATALPPQIHAHRTVLPRSLSDPPRNTTWGEGLAGGTNTSPRDPCHAYPPGSLEKRAPAGRCATETYGRFG